MNTRNSADGIAVCNAAEALSTGIAECAMMRTVIFHLSRLPDADREIIAEGKSDPFCKKNLPIIP